MNEELIQKVHDDWKQKGFPYYPKDDDWRNNIFEQLINFRRDTLVDRRNKVIGQAAHGLNLAWSYMEHAWGIKCGKMKTPMEVWHDEDHLKKGINKILSGTFFKQKPAHQITESDILLASASDAIVIGFQVRPSAGARKLAEKEFPIEKIVFNISAVDFKPCKLMFEYALT